jgi:hypothetical protein
LCGEWRFAILPEREEIYSPGRRRPNSLQVSGPNDQASTVNGRRRRVALTTSPNGGMRFAFPPYTRFAQTTSPSIDAAIIGQKIMLKTLPSQVDGAIQIVSEFFAYLSIIARDGKIKRRL